MLLGVVVALLFLPVGRGLQEASWQVMTHLPHFKLSPEEQQAVTALRTAASWANRLALAAAAILLAPVAEEMLFRGILYPRSSRPGFRTLRYGALRCSSRRCIRTWSRSCRSRCWPLR